MASRNRSRSLSTPSEGEIIESGSEMKATASKPPLNGTSVDRPPRDSTSSALRSPTSLRGSRSPRRHRSWTKSRSRSRSPYRDNRGYKRRRDDEYDGHEARHARQEPPRHFGSRYDDRPYDRNAPSAAKNRTTTMTARRATAVVCSIPMATTDAETSGHVLIAAPPTAKSESRSSTMTRTRVWMVPGPRRALGAYPLLNR